MRTYRISIEIEDFTVSEVEQAENLEQAIKIGKGIVQSLSKYAHHARLASIFEVIAQ
jgi:DNA polymerase/3'-5' exonuclease PolX